MENPENFNRRNLIKMMYGNKKIDTFKIFWGKDNDLEKWSELLSACYWEESYESVGGDKGYLENPPINIQRLNYLKELITFLENLGIRATNNAPITK